MSGNEKFLLFAYGTLRDPQVQVDTFGMRLRSTPDTLAGYRLQMTRIADQAFVELSGAAHHRTLVFTGAQSDTVDGLALEVTATELAHADNYEPAGYERREVVLQTGRTAWVFVETR